MPVIDEPPSEPEVNVTVNRPSPGVSATSAGAPGAPRGATSSEVLASPAPATLTARICTAYTVPLASWVAPEDVSVINSGEPFAPSDRARHVVPPSVEYW